MALGHICLVDEALAKKSIHTFVDNLTSAKSPAVGPTSCELCNLRKTSTEFLAFHIFPRIVFQLSWFEGILGLSFSFQKSVVPWSASVCAWISYPGSWHCLKIWPSYMRYELDHRKALQFLRKDVIFMQVRNNIMLALADMCIQYTALVDSHVQKLALCLGDPHELVRKQALALLANLLSKVLLLLS